ncbi:MAG: hypothetical protein JRJ12_13520 [Deltaproteobacteria bacterium]|nr:hypothetical protein [Deltaproteobacteria bacterium]MBW2072397.1 hypothetical protein [Deltaproteobacteria bacterium]
MTYKLLFGVLIFSLAACASVPTKNRSTEHIESRAYVEISFPSDLTEVDDFVVGNETSARSLTIFALKLEKKRKFAEAATFFHEAADLQEKGAPASSFRLSCLGAAAMCWLKAGEEEQFHRAIANIRDELDRFQRADLSDHFSVLLAISDKLKGRVVSLNPSVPLTVRTLFEVPRRMP